MKTDVDIKFLPFRSAEQLESIQIRDLILRQPLGLKYSSEELAAESAQLHLGALKNGRVVGILLLVPQENNLLKMRQFAVKEDLQGKGIGTDLVHFAEIWVRQNGYTTIYLHARETAVPFYKKLEYVIIDKPFYEVGIQHWKMIKYL